jgi:ribosomal-protein-serine acetyltransferase
MHFDPYALRPISADDATALYHLIDTNRARLADFFAGAVAATHTLADTVDHVAHMLAKREGRAYFPFAVVDTRTNTMVGFVDVKNIDWNIPKAELGAYMDAEHEGQGIASRALAAITQHCFEELGMDKLLIRTHERNTGARRVIEKNGYTQEGLVRRDYKTTSGEVVDLLYYGKVR